MVRDIHPTNDIPASPTPSGSDSCPDSHISTTQSITYWNGVDSSVSGMLGGYPQVSRIDLQGSRNFLVKLRRSQQKTKPSLGTSPSSSYTNNTNSKLALTADCGAGIGRITASFLSQISLKVDIVEPIAKFTATLLMLHPTLANSGVLGDIYNVGLESWCPPASKKYDLVWNQWCLGHLTDSQLVSYLARIATSLSANGWIVVKENLSTHGFGDDIYDDEDSSVTRSDAKFKRLFGEAGLLVVRSEVQSGFPRDLGLFPVKMYALRSRGEGDGNVEVEEGER